MAKIDKNRQAADRAMCKFDEDRQKQQKKGEKSDYGKRFTSGIILHIIGNHEGKVTVVIM